MPDAADVDARQTKSIVIIKLKPPFNPVFQVAASREESDIYIINESLKDPSLFLLATEERRTPRAEKFVHPNLNTREKVLPMVTPAPPACHPHRHNCVQYTPYICICYS